jgi:hypothetical protein
MHRPLAIPLLTSAAKLYDRCGAAREDIVQIRALLAAFALTACATTPAPASQWLLIEGCWIDASDAVPPASMVWRAVPDRPGVLAGTWAVNYTSEDPDIVQFTLVPAGNAMNLCERVPGTQESCTRAVLHGEHANDGDAVFSVGADTLEFGYANTPAAFYVGRRGACA